MSLPRDETKPDEVRGTTRRAVLCRIMRRYRLSSHAKYDLKVHLVWCPKYRKRVLTGQVATRVRDLLRQIAAENELEIISGKVAADHVHMFISYRAHQNISRIVQWLKGTSSRVLLQEFPHLKKQYWGRHLWASGYFAVTSGTITDEMIKRRVRTLAPPPYSSCFRAFQARPTDEIVAWRPGPI